MRLKITLAYDGSGFAGWQIQERPDPPPTIQGAVEAALLQLTGVRIRVHGAGRTDAGVHALGQVCHCDVPDLSWQWQKRLNAVLPSQIRVAAAECAAPAFHARKDARAKIYIYDLWPSRIFVPPALAPYLWACGNLDSGAMQSGLQAFCGEYDFASFQNSGTDIKSTVRNITAISLEEQPELAYLPAVRILRLTIRGNGFLKQMVRNIAGFLVAVGKHKVCWNDLESILAQRSRQALPTPTAPANGLSLAKVEY